MNLQSPKVNGLTPAQLDLIGDVVRKSLPGVEAWLFGSRVKGTHKPFSDVDVCLKGHLQIPDHLIALLREHFQDSDLPYKVDLVDYHGISADFRALVDSHAVRVI